MNDDMGYEPDDETTGMRPLTRREHVNVARDMAAFVTAQWSGDTDRAGLIIGSLEGREFLSAFGALASITRAALRMDPDTPLLVFLATIEDLLDAGVDE